MAFDIDLTFESDISKLADNFKQLLSLTTQTSDAVKKTNTAIQTESRKSAIEVASIEKAYKNTAKAIGELNTTGLDSITLSVDKQAIALDQATKETEDLQQAADKLVDSLFKGGVEAQSSSVKIVTAIAKETKAFEDLLAERLLATDPKDQQRLNLEIAKQVSTIKSLNGELEKLNDTPPADSQAESFKRLQLQIREAEKEAQQLGVDYGVLDERFLAARDKAALLKEQLDDINASIKAGNPEQKFKAFETAVGGVIGSFQALTGALQLFGGESEEVQKIAQKLQGLFNFSQGINTLFTLKDSFSNLLGVLGLTTRATVTNTVATVAQGTAATGTAAAITSEAVATNVATTATNRFTAALLANPFTAIAVALAAIVTAIVIYSQTADDSAEQQKKLNDELEAQIDVLKRLSDEISSSSKVRVDSLNAETLAAKTAGLSVKEIQQIEKDAAAQRLEAATDTANLYKDQIKNLDNLISSEIFYFELIKQYKREGKDPELIKEKERELKLIQDKITSIRGVVKELKDARDAQGLLNLEQAKQNDAIELEKLRAIAKEKIIIARDGSKAELEAKLESLQLEEAAQIRALDNDSARDAKRLAIIAETNKKRLELENEYLIEVLKRKKTADDIAVLQSLEGSRKELDAKIKVIEDESRIQLAAINITENEKLRIQLETEKKIRDLKSAFVLKEVSDAINREKTDAALRLALAEEFSIQELQAKKDLITAQEELDITAINNSKKNELDKIAEINLIKANAIKSREKLEQDAFKRQLDFEAQFAKQTSDIKLKELQRQIDDESVGNLTKINLQREYANEQLKQIEVEKAENIDLYNNKLITLEQYLLKKKELEEKAADVTSGLSKIEAQKFNDIWNALGLDLNDNEKRFADQIVQNVTSIYDSLTAIRQADLEDSQRQNDALLSSIENSISATTEAINQEIELAKLGYANNVDAKKQELEALNKLKQQGLEKSKQIAKEEEKLARIQAVIDASRQAGAITVAAANLFAEESTKGVAGVVIAIGALSLILSTFLAFKASANAAAKPVNFGDGGTLDSGTLKGKSHQRGGMRIEGTNMFVEGEEEVIKKRVAKKRRKVLKAINDENFNDLTYGDIKFLLEGTGVAMRPEVAQEIIQDKAIMQTINQNAIIKAETEPLRKEMIAMKEELKGLRKDNSKKDSITLLGDGSYIEKKGSTTNIVRKS